MTRQLVLSRHARSRLEERFPGRIREGQWRREILAGIRDGRVATERPRWLQHAVTETRPQQHRYVWTGDGARCYVLRLVDGRHVRTWLVVTVLSAPRDLAA